MKMQVTKSRIKRPNQSQILNRLLLAKEKRRAAIEGGACVRSEETGLLAIGVSR
jgi:hypothetical protein